MVTPIRLQVTLAAQLPTIYQAQPLSIPIPVSIHNPAHFPVTVLKWNTPFDPRAGVLGVFKIVDTITGKTLPVDTIKISRKLPASTDDLIEIPADQTIDTVANLPQLHLEVGHEYSVHAQGIWHAVWGSRLADVTASQLEQLAGARRGEFRSNVAVVKVE